MSDIGIYASLIKTKDDLKENIKQLETLKQTTGFDNTQWKDVLRQAKNYLCYCYNGKINFVNGKIIGYKIDKDVFARRGDNGDGNVTSTQIDKILGNRIKDAVLEDCLRNYWIENNLGEWIEGKNCQFWCVDLDYRLVIKQWWEHHRNDSKIQEILKAEEYLSQEQKISLEQWLHNETSEESLKSIASISDPTSYSNAEDVISSLYSTANMSSEDIENLRNLITIIQKHPVISLDNYSRIIPLSYSLARYRLNMPMGDASKSSFEYYRNPLSRFPASRTKLKDASSKIGCEPSDESLVAVCNSLNLEGCTCVNSLNQTSLYWEILWHSLKLGEKVKTESSEVSYWLTGTVFSETEQIENFVKNQYWEGGQVPKSQIMNDIKSVKKGDILIAKSSAKKGPKHSISFVRIKAVGIVLSDMILTDTKDWYRCDVEWTKLSDTKDFEGPAYGKYLGTMHLCKENELKEFADKILGNNNMKMDDYDKYVKLLEANKNIILNGAPGTGKTYLAKKIAEAMDAEYEMVQFHQSYDYTDFVEGLRPAKSGDDNENVSFNRIDGSFKKICKKALGIENQHYQGFDSAYNELLKDIKKKKLKFTTLVRSKTFSVEVNGNKNLYAIPDTETATKMPITKENLQTYIETGKIKDWKPYVTSIGEYLRNTYSEKLGPLKKDKPTEKKKYIFHIDEINRGEISKIFGELFFSIDPGYRGEKGRINTQYQNLVEEGDTFENGFFVPENVYIIGTMNDIDRSVESMDFAMRRRFAFKEVTAEESMSMLDSEGAWKGNDESGVMPPSSVLVDLKARMAALNKEIAKPEYNLGDAYQIGAAYFLKFGLYFKQSTKEGDEAKADDAFEKLRKYHLEGLLREYLRGMDPKDDLLDKLLGAYDKTVEKEAEDDSKDTKNPDQDTAEVVQ